MQFICYKRCSTCARAKKFLDDNNIKYEYREIIEDIPTAKELKEIHKKSGKDIKKLFNTSGQKYRELNLKDKLKDMTDDEKYKLLSTDGILIKRPILLGDDFALLGFKEEEYKENLKIK